MIKKFLNYFVICTVVILGSCAFTACSDNDDDDDNGVSGGLVGAWLATGAEGWEKENGVIVDQWNDAPGEDYQVVYNLKKDGTLETYLNGELKETLKWSSKGDKITMSGVEEGEPFSTTAKYKISGKNLVITYTEKGSENGVTYEYYQEMKFTRTTL